ncbi:hypothetical protein DL546_002523 [Coniochaeta pulveracea]|uniref:DNA (cytosine-5)-methyltransferase 1 replication foci domain-containing protein n=1 Tax=Coniochaeta pulveracea TaxID=177199 RepID=A0A420Y291_9PEZI|nr:hypothetical protein DL546_002523 [Coniochaeta pulveracea]
MPRHRRKVSSSTVASVDASVPNSQVVYRNVETVLRRLEATPENEDSNTWPCFVLSNAIVLHKDGQRMANPLLPELPLVIRGRLDVDRIDKRDRASLLIPQGKSVYIEVKTSWKYSFDSAPNIWVSSPCGWLQILPSPEYQETFEQACEAAALYYSFLDIHEEHAKEFHRAAMAKKKRQQTNALPRLTLDQILFQYALDVGDGIFREEAEELCHKWAPFLISHLPKEGAFNWEETDFYRWLIDAHPDVYKKSLKIQHAHGDLPKKAGASKKSASASPIFKPSVAFASPDPIVRAHGALPQGLGTSTRGQSENSDIEMKDAPAVMASNNTRRGSLRTGSSDRKLAQDSPQPSAAPSHHASPLPPSLSSAVVSKASTPASTGLPTTGASAIVRLMQAMDEIIDKLNTSPTKVSKSQICSNLYYSWRIKEYRGSAEIVSYFARELFEKLPPKWHGGKFWAWLSEEVKNPQKPLEYSTLESLPSQLVPRAKKPIVSTQKTPTSSSRPNLQVRPKVKPVSTQPDSDSDTDTDSDEENEHRRAVKGGLRMTSASKKRKASVLDSTEQESASLRGRKSVNYGQYFYDPDQDIEAESDSDEVESDQAPEDEEVEKQEEVELGFDGLPQLPQDTVRMVIHAEKQPTMCPTGFNGTWVCDREDCDYVVRAAEEEAGRAQIREHFRQHDMVSDKVTLALTEGRRGNMPMNHLLDKIRTLGKKSLAEKKQKIDGITLPDPIKQRLLI